METKLQQQFSNHFKEANSVCQMETKTMIPSEQCLNLREQNLSFQLQIWSQATSPNIIVPNPAVYGWEKKENAFLLKPDSELNMEKQATIYETIMRKCKCKKSQCTTGRCACKKNKNMCSSFCECLNCENTNEFNKQSKQAEEIIQLQNIYDDDDDGISTSGSEMEAGEVSEDEFDLDDI